MKSRWFEYKVLLLHRIVFENIGKKMKPGSFKTVMDVGFRLFEKLSQKFSVLADIYLNMYSEIIEKEITLANISSTDRALVIGGGALPATPFLLAQRTQATIVSIDRDKKAVQQGKKFLTRYHLDKNITMMHADGQTYPVNSFTVIIIVYGVKHQPNVLRHIAETMNPTARVIYRTVLDENGKSPLDISPYFTIKKSVRSEAFGYLDSLLLLKNNEK